MDLNIDEDVELQRALAMSLQEQQLQPRYPPPHGSNHLGYNDDYVDNDNEEELAKVLAMSLEHSDTSPTCSRSSHDPMEDTSLPVMEATAAPSSAVSTATTTTSVSTPSSALPLSPILPVDTSKLSPLVQQAFQTLAPCTNETISQMHNMIWDPLTTVHNDQVRWLAQSVIFKDMSSSTNVTTDTSAAAAAFDTATTHFDTVMEHSDRWGLVQAHGGPCGVLASVQAELLRILLFGGASGDSGDITSDTSSTSILLLPTIPIPPDSSSSSSSLASQATHPKEFNLSPHFLQASLALSLGIILARAAIQPSVSSTLAGDSSNDNNTQHTSTEATPSIPTVKLIFPKQVRETGMDKDNEDPPVTTHLEWTHFAPWGDDSTTTGSTLEQKYLASYTISSGTETNIDNKDNLSTDYPLDQETALAHAVATFLLETKLWQWYTRQGGVLLFVMALIQSRTCSKIKSDMDDPTAKLTSQFGYCSQELLNLLLTGQAGKTIYLLYDC